jgi:hypothetical protein
LINFVAATDATAAEHMPILTQILEVFAGMDPRAPSCTVTLTLGMAIAIYS